MLVAFDVDGTLIDDEDNPRWHVIDLLRGFHACGAKVVVWSGGGANYAEHWVRRLNLAGFVRGCYDKHATGMGLPVPDLAIDDESVDLGVVNWKVAR